MGGFRKSGEGDYVDPRWGVGIAMGLVMLLASGVGTELDVQTYDVESIILYPEKGELQFELGPTRVSSSGSKSANPYQRLVFKMIPHAIISEFMETGAEEAEPLLQVTLSEVSVNAIINRGSSFYEADLQLDFWDPGGPMAIGAGVPLRSKTGKLSAEDFAFISEREEASAGGVSFATKEATPLVHRSFNQRCWWCRGR